MAPVKLILILLLATVSSLFAEDLAFIAALQSATAAGGGSPPTFPPDVVFYAKMDESSGDMAPHVGDVATCTLTNMSSVGFTTGKINNAPDIVGASFDYFMTATNSPELDLGGTDYSISVWVKPSASSADAFDFYFSKESAAGTDGTYYLRSGGDTNLLWYHFTGPGPDVFSTPARSIEVGSWSHVAVVYNGSTVKIYVNGSESSSTSHSSDIRTLNTSPLVVGYAVGIGGAYTGQVDELGIWKRALSGTEVTDLYNGGTGLQP